MSGHLFLVGFMGSGKSTVGRILADRLGRRFIDLDERIEESAGATVRELFALEGESAFRTRESRALAELENADDAVVACGGGVVLREENRAMLARLGTVVHLETDAATALRRVGDSDVRPLLDGLDRAQVEELARSRAALYAEVADIVVDTVGRTPDQVADDVLLGLEAEGM